MSDEGKKSENKNCCYDCLKAIVIALILLTIGFLFGHATAFKHRPCYNNIGPYWDGHRAVCPVDKGKKWGEKKDWFGQKLDQGKCKPGCTCPKCSDPNKVGCPMKDKKADAGCPFTEKMKEKK